MNNQYYSTAIWAKETPHESARTLLPPLEYLAREARSAALPEVAAILDQAVVDIAKWVRKGAH